MCTISLVPLDNSQNKFVLTSNRDEVVTRNTLPLDFVEYKGAKLLLPTDEKAGGSWIGASSRRRVICLMNGEFKPHKRYEPYHLSRGIIVKEFLAAEVGSDFLQEYPLKGVEAFTLILAEWHQEWQFFELVWDEKKRHLRHLKPVPKIWSSSPLYSPEMKQLREEWFAEITNDLQPENILNFHHTAGAGNKETALIMDRGFLKTQSISQIKADDSGVEFWYKNLENSQVTQKRLSFN